jgi:hypothetical protein
MSALPEKNSRRLPSVEAQTMAFVAEGRSHSRGLHRWLRWGGIEVYLRHVVRYVFPTGQLLVGEYLVVANVRVPKALQGRGWLWRYLQLCALLARDGIVLECVVHPGLRAALRRRPAFCEYPGESFVLDKPSGDDWPPMRAPD